MRRLSIGAKHGASITDSGMYPTAVRLWKSKEEAAYPKSKHSSCYVVCVEGKNVAVSRKGTIDDAWVLSEGDCLSINYPFEFLGDGIFVVIERFGFNCINTKVQWEEQGRLSYIDGCTDSMLIPPPRYGDPSLNYLHFPVGIDQSQHRHPDIRAGVIVGGRGTAYANHGYKGGAGHEQSWAKDLEVGDFFILPENELHSFKTNKGEEMEVIAYHPSTDGGPTDQSHAMLNRTYLREPK